MEHKKILKVSKKSLIVTIILTVLATAAFIAMVVLNTPGKNVECDVYNDLINLKQDEENKYVQLEIATLPFEFAEKKENSSTQKFYFVADESSYLYIVRLSPKKYEEIKKEHDKNPDNFRYTLKGYIFNSPYDLKKLAINAYNRGREVSERISYADFESYFGKTYLDDRITPNTNIATTCLAIGAFMGIFAFVSLCIFLNNAIKTKSTIKKYGMQELESELEASDVIAYEKANTYLTNKFVMSNMCGLRAIKYEDILWTYMEKRRQNGVTVGKYLLVLTKDGKREYVSSNLNEDTLKEIMEKIYLKNNSVLIGFTAENNKEYKRLRKEIRNNNNNNKTTTL